MTATPRRTASAAAVSRLLGPAPEAGWIRRSSVAGFTVAQAAADVVEIEWHGPDSQRADAFALITRLLDGPYDVEQTTAQRGTHSTYVVAVLRITPGTPVAAVEGTEATADDVTAPSYVSRAPWETERTAPRYATAPEARDAVAHAHDDHGTATIDPATGVITLHLGKDRTERHTLTPSTPEQRAAHRTELQRTAAHWADQARRATEERARLRGAVDTCHPSQRHHVETRLRTVEDSVQRSHAAAAKAEDAAHALDDQPESTPVCDCYATAGRFEDDGSRARPGAHDRDCTSQKEH